MSQPRPNRKAEQSRVTRGRLIAVASDLFAARGFADVSIEEVVRSADMTRGALYHHFENKEDLFRAVFEAAEADLVERVSALATGDDALARLQSAMDATLDACREPVVRQIVFKDGTAVLGWEESRAIMDRYALGVLKGALEQAKNEGVLQPVGIDATAHVLLGALTEGALLVAAAAEPERTQEAVSHALAYILAGLRA